MAQIADPANVEAVLAPPGANIDDVVAYLRNVGRALAGATPDELDSCFGERFNARKEVTQTCEAFSCDTEASSLFILKHVDPDSKDSQIAANSEPETVIAVIKKPGVLDSTASLESQLQAVVLPMTGPGSSPYEVLHSMLHFAVGPYFDAFCRASRADPGSTTNGSAPDDKSVIPAARRKITELELSFLHLQQNSQISEPTLAFHPAVEAAVQRWLSLSSDKGVNPPVDLVEPASLLSDTSFLNSLQNNVNTWIRSIQTITRMTRDPRSGTASQEINFWVSMEVVLKNIDEQLQSPGVSLTLEVLRHAKRFHATVSFLSDTGISEALETVGRYNQLMKDFPLDELISASSLAQAQQAVDSIFSHLNKKLRITPYPIWRALALVEAISGDLDSSIKSLLRSKRIMLLDFVSFKAQILQVTDVFATWDECIKDFVSLAREVTRKRSEKFIPIRINSRHAKTAERLDYILEFRKRHDKLRTTLENVLSNDTSAMPIEFADLDPLKEVHTAYDYFRQLDVLDTSDDGINQWDATEKTYNETISRIEQAIIAILRDRLAVARTSSEMFRVFSKFNALFVRPAIRGAIQEYQNRLIENVKSDVTTLQDRFRQKYSNSDAFEMSKLRDIPMVAGTIGWMHQMEAQLDLSMQRMEDILGKGWQVYSEGQKLHADTAMFRKKLDPTPVFQEWLNGIMRKTSSLSISGNVFSIIRSRANGSLELRINFDAEVITLFKEVRNLQWMSFQIPHSVASVAKDAKRVYPFAVSLIDSLHSLQLSVAALRGEPELDQLLFGTQNALLQLLSKGLLLKWEAFVHAYDLQAIMSSPSASATPSDSRHVKFVHDVEESVNALEVKSTTARDICTTIGELLETLSRCEFNTSAFSQHLSAIQQSIDKLNLDSYSNVPSFVDSLNDKIRQIFITRSQNAIDQWIAGFQDVNAHGGPSNIVTHELTLRNQVIFLSPPVQSTRVLWLTSLQKLISPICSLKRIEANTFNVNLGTSRTLTSFSDISVPLSDRLTKAFEIVDDFIVEAEAYLGKWYQFQALWDLEASTVFDMLEDDMTKWLQILGEIRKVRTTFDTNEVSKRFGLLVIDFKPVQARINAKYDTWQREIVHQFANRLNTRMKDTCATMEKVRRDLERSSLIEASSTELVVAAISSIQLAQSKLSEWETELSLFRQGQTTLSRYRYQFPPAWMFMDQLDNEWGALREILERRSRTLGEQQDAIRAKVRSEAALVVDRFHRLEEQWQTERPVSGSLDAKSCLSLVTKYESESNEIANSVLLMNQASSVLSFDPISLPGLPLVQEEIRDFGSVWNAMDSVLTALNELRDTPWAVVAPRKIRQRLDELVDLSKNMPSRIRQYSAAQHVQNLLKNLLKTVPLLMELKSEAIHERHWETLYEQLLTTSSKRIYFMSMTLGDVWDLNISVNATKVRDVVATAQGEMALEAFIRQVRDTWSSFSLDLINYQNKCRLIKNWDDIFQKCSDHLGSLSAMHNSPYFKVWEEDARSWEDKLNRVHVLFDTWIDVQRQWVYLEGIFNLENEEIKHILPLESARFQNINSELFVILRKVQKSALILDVLNIAGIRSSIDRLADQLAKVQKALGEYFEKERRGFGRFYFLGDEDLLEIISNSADVRRAQKHLTKLFSGVAGLLFDQENGIISGVTSREGEVVHFSSPIVVAKFPKARDWLAELEKQIRENLAEQLSESVEVLSRIFEAGIDSTNLFEWMEAYPTQVSLLASQVTWTQTIETALKTDSSFAELEKLEKRHNCILLLLASLVRDDLTVIVRKRCESLISELVHQRGIISQLLKERVASVFDFSWRKQMTYQLSSSDSGVTCLTVSQANASFSYGFEYLGIPDKLIQTPLVDSCFLTMTQALDQRLGGSPFGPAGTGKTESIKALGQCLGKFVLVFCCDEYFDYQAIGRILVGICQVGAWGCFDEFNRLNPRILSAVSSQVEAIELGLREINHNQKEIELIGRKVPLNDQTGIFITMNPGYAGRNTLPENLRKLFRGFSMAKPDRELIAEVVLYSQGFAHASELAGLIVPYFEAMKVGVSEQIHYDFGLRALKNVLVISGSLRRRRFPASVETSASGEAEVILRALRETISPKLISTDRSAMLGIEKRIFVNVDYVSDDHDEVSASIRTSAESLGFVSSEEWLGKAIDLHRFQQIHHGIMLVGPSGSGKSATYRTVLKALELLESIESAYYLIDAKVMSKECLYGVLDPTTREWTDGIFTATLRKISENLRGESKKRHWIVFDGEVDPEWVENLNSVLDDNKVLTLPNGERIELPDNVRILFEVENLDFATPATVSRCGMIWFEQTVVSLAMELEYMTKALVKPDGSDDVEDDVVMSSAELVRSVNPMGRDTLLDIFKVVPIEDIALKAKEFSHIMEFSGSRALGTLFSMVKSACLRMKRAIAQELDFPPTEEQTRSFFKKSIGMALLWSFAGDCRTHDRETFGRYLLSLSPFIDLLPESNSSLLDYDPVPASATSQNQWEKWISKVPYFEVDGNTIATTDVVVPTVDTVRHESLIYRLLHDHKPVILCGPPGSGKTMTLFNALRKSQNFDVVGLNFSKATTPELVMRALEQHCSYTKTLNGTVLAPSRIGRWLVVFCDELNLPAKDRYGTQRVISMLRQMISENGFWRPQDKKWVSLSRIQFVGACNPPTDVGRIPLNPRFLRNTAVIFVDYPGEESLQQIYRVYNTAILKVIPGLKAHAEDLTSAMIELYLRSQAQFTAAKSAHYIYSPRELTRWVRGTFESIRALETLSSEGLVRIWAHEALRLFHDRLIEDDERIWTNSLVAEVARHHFPGTDLNVALIQPILYSNWLSRNYQPVELDKLKAFVQARLRTFCEEEVDAQLVLFDDLLDHVLRIDRVMRQPQGHLILIGASSSGKTTLSRFVAWMNGIKVHQLKTSRKYGEEDFASDLREILKLAGCQGQRTCFILDESNILETSFLERMNTLLANGEVPGLFEGDDFTMLMTACREGALRQGLNLDSHEELYKWFTTEVTRNLHVVFTMNPSDAGLNSHTTTSPALFNRCVLNWMGNWSNKALLQVASSLTDRVNIDNTEYSVPPTIQNGPLETPRSFRESVLHTIVSMHRAVRSVVTEGNKAVVVGERNPSPGTFLVFVKNFVVILNEKRTQLEDQQRHLNVGLDKIRGTVLKVRELKTGLAEKKSQLEAKSEEAKEMLRQMVSNQNEAERKREASIRIQHALDIQETNIAKRQEVVYHDLAKAEPAVIEAQKSVSNIKKQHLTELRSMGNPPEAVKLTLESVCVMLGQRITSWKEVQLYIRRDDFIASIVNFDGERQMTPSLRRRMESEFLSRPNFNFDAVNRASKACGPLLQWIEAQVAYASILERVGPLKNEVLQLEEEAVQTKAQAQAISDMIDELEKSIETYKDDYAALITETQAIKSEMAVVEHKVNRSIQLVDSLSSEKSRWSVSVKEFEAKSERIVGNSLLAAGFLAYVGGLDRQLRGDLLNSWRLFLEQASILFDGGLGSISEHLVDPKQRLKWYEQGLSPDDLSVENAAILERCVRYPLIVDPTSRIIDFVKSRHNSRTLTITSFLDEAFIKHLESALRFGNPILVQDAEYLDPIISRVLNREYKRAGGRTLLELGRQDIDFSPGFRMYLFSRDPSICVPPHISSRTTLVNFTVTRSSLESQALNAILLRVRPDIEAKRREILKVQGEYRVGLRLLEENLLAALNESEGSLLDNDSVVDTLETLKVEWSEISQKIEEGEQIFQVLNENMELYRPLGSHCSRLFAVLEALARVQPVYQFSLEFFFQILESSLKANVEYSQKRVDKLVKQLYVETYERVSCGLLKEDQVLLKSILVYLYKGDFDFDVFQQLAEVEVDVSSEKSLAEAKKRFKIDSTGDALQAEKGLWQQTDDNRTMLYRLLWTLAVSSEKYVDTINESWTELMDSDEVALDLRRVIIDQSDNQTPIALCSSRGADPSFRIQAISEHRCDIIAMGSKEGIHNATSAIETASRDGTWVLLQNLQLAPDWLESIEKQLKSLRPVPNFRLFYTFPLEASSEIPVTLLRISRILTFELSSGVKSSMRQTFYGLPKDRIERMPSERARLLYLLSWVHGVILERLRFVPLGWNKIYDFNDTDYESGAFVIDKWIDVVGKSRVNIAPNSIPWKALTGLLSESIYGAKVDHITDKDTIDGIVRAAFCEAAFNLEFSFVKEDNRTVLPEQSSLSSLREWIERLPDREPPEWLGLPSDADIAMLRIESKRLVEKSHLIVDGVIRS